MSEDKAVTKASRAKALFEANPGISTKDFVAKLMTDLEMTHMGARTYAYNCRRDAGKVTPKLKSKRSEEAVAAAEKPAPVVKTKATKSTKSKKGAESAKTSAEIEAETIKKASESGDNILPGKPGYPALQVPEA